MPDNTIETLSVTLTGDASQLARDVEKAMQDTISTMEATAEEIAAANSKIFEDLIAEVKEAQSSEAFQQFILQFELLGKTMEESISIAAQNLGKDLDFVKAKVDAARATVESLIDMQTDLAVQSAAERIQ
jgi:hypothetical protein